MADISEITLPLGRDAETEIHALARRSEAAGGPLLRALNALGGRFESGLDRLPVAARSALDSGAEVLLLQAYRTAGRVGASALTPPAGAWGHRIAAAAGGALGGAGGIASALVELPATVTLFFSAMQKAAAEEGFDPASEETRLLCLEIFGSGGPMSDDDGINSSFLGTRLALNGVTLQAVILRVLPGATLLLGQKLASQAIPVLGAAAGAAVNFAFISYFTEAARIRFALKRLAAAHGEAAVIAAFRDNVAALRKGALGSDAGRT